MPIAANKECDFYLYDKVMGKIVKTEKSLDICEENDNESKS